MNVVVPAVGSVIAAVLGYWFRWLVAKRKTSGKIDTTEAGQLWEVLMGELTRMRDEVAGVRASALSSFNETLDLRSALADAKLENSELRTDNHRWRNEVTGLRGQVEILTSENAALRAAAPPAGQG